MRANLEAKEQWRTAEKRQRHWVEGLERAKEKTKLRWRTRVLCFFADNKIADAGTRPFSQLGR